ncbi:MAG: hypothetical protein JWM16_6158 [Verrucomicrobiales bacterium]|nr:hypothetical protein [Verrucomicrobiales bacterium]
MTRTLIVLAVLLCAGLVIRSRWQAWTLRRAQTAAAAAGLREQVLSRRMLPPRPDGDPTVVRGVVMDWSLGSGVATLIAIDDGTVSLYLNPGGGVIGAGTHPAVARAAAAFRQEGLRVRHAFIETSSFSAPGPDSMAFYILTDAATLKSGVVAADQIGKTGDPLGPLGAAAQALLTEVRRAK